MKLERSNVNHRVLVIDDNKSIHDDFKKILQPHSASGEELDTASAALFGEELKSTGQINFEIDSAFQGREGLELVEKSVTNARPYAMAFVDVRMPPGWDGIETINRFWKVDPDIQVVLCTAYSDYSWDEMIQQLGHSDRLVILKKPFDNIEVLQLAHALTEKWGLLQQSKFKMEELEQMVTRRTGELRAANEKLMAEMYERQKTEGALRQSQKMDAIGKLAGGIAHDFNNLLTVILGYANVLLSEEQLSGQAVEAINEIHGASQRAINLTSQLLVFGRKQSFRQQSLNLKEVVSSAGKILRRLLGEDIAIEIAGSDSAPAVLADRAMIEQVLFNLAINSRDAMPYGGTLKITTEPVEFNETNKSRYPNAKVGKFVCLSITDTGDGIEPEVLQHLFEPFYTTKEPGKGTGLGLATVYGIVTQHKGWVEVDSKIGSGATFRVYIPVNDKPAEQMVPTATHGKVAGGKETILLVEDEKALCMLAKATLQRYGYKVLPARSGKEALEIWSKHKDGIDLLFTDIIMPDGVSGIELSKLLLAERPELKVSYASGYSLEVINQRGVFHDNLNFLPKPYELNDLALTVRNCLDNTEKLPVLSLE